MVKVCENESVCHAISNISVEWGRFCDGLPPAAHFSYISQQKRVMSTLELPHKDSNSQDKQGECIKPVKQKQV